MFSCGVNLGTVRELAIEARASALFRDGRQLCQNDRLDRNDERLAHYLRGETIPCGGSPGRLTAVLVDGVPLLVRRL